jgi:hypothetical protein
LFSKLIEQIIDLPQLKDLNPTITQYKPGHTVFQDSDVAKYGRKLFTTRYGAKAPTLLFRIKDEYKNSVSFEIKGTNNEFTVNKNKLIPALRSYAGVNVMDITGEEDFAIADFELLKKIGKAIGLVDETLLKRSLEDIKIAYKNYAGNIALTRRLQLTTTNYLAFYSNNQFLALDVVLCMRLSIDPQLQKALTLYLNSTFTLAQVLALISETRGAWVDIYEDPAWSLIHIPDFDKLETSVIKEAIKVFEEIGKIEVKPFVQRIKEKDKIQRKIDEISMKMLGIDFELNKLYDVLAKELDILDFIMKMTSRSRSRRSRREEYESYQITLDEF